MVLNHVHRKLSFEAKIFALLVILLLLFDRGFSKLAIIGPIFLHDVLLLIALFFSIYKFPKKIKFPSILLLILISIGYLVFSILIYKFRGDYFLMIFRHYFLFFYLTVSYLLANKIFNKEENIEYAIDFIIKISKWSFILQIIYFIFLFITVPNYTPLKGFSYLSAVGVMGIITYGAYILSNFKGVKRLLLFSVTLFVSAMLGHASSFFALFAVFLVHFFISFTQKQRAITLSVLILLFVILIQMPQFNDANASWRLLFWGEILNDAIFNNYLIFGNGFGQPFVSLEFAEQVVSELGSYNLIGNNNEMVRWEVPPHNSFLTIIFHIGLFPFFLLLIPLKSVLQQVFFKSKTKDVKELFLFYSLIGVSVWTSFNVILELPHSAIYFWLIFFTYIFYNAKKT